MNSLKLLVTVDLGLDSDNPVIQISPYTSVSSTIRSFTRQWALPTITTDLILQEIKKELEKNDMELDEGLIEPKDQDSTFIEQEKEIGWKPEWSGQSSCSGFSHNSPIKQILLTPYTPYQRLPSSLVHYPGLSGNWSICHKLTNSPPNTIQTPINKSHLIPKQKNLSFSYLIECKIRELYRELAGHSIPPQQYLCPEHINLQAFCPDLLQCLLSFF